MGNIVKRDSTILTEKNIPLVIPAYEPDSRLVDLMKDIRDKARIKCMVIIVDDGSGYAYKSIFNEAKAVLQEKCVVISYEVNKGKGTALKTAFKYVIENMPDVAGCVTADSDGQHTVECIESIMAEFGKNPDKLILGVRNFNGDDVPWKSSFGNKLTMKVMEYASGLRVSDTQTGLRGIPIGFMRDLLDVKGDRFEFETQMLLESYGKFPIIEIPIKTIYDSKENHQTHFNPIIDSIKIYKILCRKFIAYIFSSLSSCVLDLALFAVFCSLLKGETNYIAISTVAARVISATYNYLINYKVVFKSAENHFKATIKYIALACFQMILSAVLVTIFASILSVMPEVVLKAIVDTLLFFASFYIQRRFVFK